MFEVLSFLGLHSLIAIWQSGDYSRLASFDGISAVLWATVPILLLIEAGRALLGRRQWRSYAWCMAMYAMNRIVAVTLSISVLVWTIGMVQPWQPFQVSGPLGFVYAYVVWELAHYVYHRSAHRCRLLWCLHAQHHAPEDMHLMVGHAHHVLEGPYADLVRPAICLMLGVPVPMLLVIMTIDGLYGWIIHVSPDTYRSGRFGWLGKVILTPSDHRVHHARNPEYIDRNYSNLLPVWDRAFGSYTPETVTPDYGIKRRPQTFVSMYFGEACDLIRDVRARPGVGNKLITIFGPPDWQPVVQTTEPASFAQGKAAETREAV